MATQAQLVAVLDGIRRDINSGLIGREYEVEACLTAAIAGENFLMVGVPGTAKSTLSNAMADALGGGEGFSYLMSKFTTPDELFGPYSLTALKQDKYCRVTSGKLPEKRLAFLDEVFKSNSAVLNTLLPIMNERTFNDGNGSKKIPLEMMIGASNEWPVGEGFQDLGALFDRFVVRLDVKNLRGVQRKALIAATTGAGIPEIVISRPIDKAELQEAREQARKLPFAPETVKVMDGIIGQLEAAGVVVSERRIVKAAKVARAAAWMAGSPDVQPEHLQILECVLWDEPREQPAKCREIVSRSVNPDAFAVAELMRQATEVLSTVDVTNAAAASVTIGKLKEIENQFKKMSSPMAARAVKELKEQVAAIKDAVRDAM